MTTGGPDRDGAVAVTSGASPLGTPPLGDEEADVRAGVAVRLWPVATTAVTMPAATTTAASTAATTMRRLGRGDLTGSERSGGSGGPRSSHSTSCEPGGRDGIGVAYRSARQAPGPGSSGRRWMCAGSFQRPRGGAGSGRRCDAAAAAATTAVSAATSSAVGLPRTMCNAGRAAGASVSLTAGCCRASSAAASRACSAASAVPSPRMRGCARAESPSRCTRAQRRCTG